MHFPSAALRLPSGSFGSGSKATEPPCRQSDRIPDAQPGQERLPQIHDRRAECISALLMESASLAGRHGKGCFRDFGAGRHRPAISNVTRAAPLRVQARPLPFLIDMELMSQRRWSDGVLFGHRWTLDRPHGSRSLLDETKPRTLALCAAGRIAAALGTPASETGGEASSGSGAQAAATKRIWRCAAFTIRGLPFPQPELTGKPACHGRMCISAIPPTRASDAANRRAREWIFPGPAPGRERTRRPCLLQPRPARAADRRTSTRIRCPSASRGRPNPAPQAADPTSVRIWLRTSRVTGL